MASAFLLGEEVGTRQQEINPCRLPCQPGGVDNATHFVDTGRIALAVGLINWLKQRASSARQR